MSFCAEDVFFNNTSFYQKARSTLTRAYFPGETGGSKKLPGR